MEMGTPKGGWWLGAVLVVLMGGASAGEAAEVKVLSAGAVRGIVTDLAEAFQRETGHAVTDYRE